MNMTVATCKEGHALTADNICSKNRCRTCIRERARSDAARASLRAWRSGLKADPNAWAEYRGRQNQSNRSYKDRNRERVRSYNKAYRAARKPHRAACLKTWRRKQWKFVAMDLLRKKSIATGGEILGYGFSNLSEVRLGILIPPKKSRCVHGHTRSLRAKSCVECHRVWIRGAGADWYRTYNRNYQRRWRAANRQRVAEYNRRQRERSRAGSVKETA